MLVIASLAQNNRHFRPSVPIAIGSPGDGKLFSKTLKSRKKYLTHPPSCAIINLALNEIVSR